MNCPKCKRNYTTYFIGKDGRAYLRCFDCYTTFILENRESIYDREKPSWKKKQKKK